MQMYVPPVCTVAPVARAALSRAAARAGHTGSAMPTCATMPSPKKEETRRFVASKNWLGTTRSSGWIVSFMLPTAEIEMTHSAPSDFSPQMLARKFSSVGVRRWPRPCRGRKITGRPWYVPAQYSSEGSPNGVRTRRQRTSVSPSSS